MSRSKRSAGRTCNMSRKKRWTTVISTYLPTLYKRELRCIALDGKNPRSTCNRLATIRLHLTCEYLELLLFWFLWAFVFLLQFLLVCYFMAQESVEIIHEYFPLPQMWPREKVGPVHGECGSTPSMNRNGVAWAPPRVLRWSRMFPSDCNVAFTSFVVLQCLELYISVCRASLYLFFICVGYWCEQYQNKTVQ